MAQGLRRRSLRHRVAGAETPRNRSSGEAAQLRGRRKIGGGQGEAVEAGSAERLRQLRKAKDRAKARGKSVERSFADSIVCVESALLFGGPAEPRSDYLQD